KGQFNLQDENILCIIEAKSLGIETKSYAFLKKQKVAEQKQEIAEQVYQEAYIEQIEINNIITTRNSRTSVQEAYIEQVEINNIVASTELEYEKECYKEEINIELN
ncbi:4177_t:CDS:2, partial [Dentiscutata heterogama]